MVLEFEIIRIISNGFLSDAASGKGRKEDFLLVDEEYSRVISCCRNQYDGKGCVS